MNNAETMTDEILEFSDPCDKICDAFALAQRKFGPIDKDKTAAIGEGDKAKYSYSYADLASVLAATQPHLNDAGIAFLQGLKTQGVKVTIETRLVHGGQWIRNRVTLEAADAKPQKLASAMTYGRRYSALAVLGVAPAEDDDGKGAGTKDEVEARLVELQTELTANARLAEDRHKAISAIVKRLIARGVPAEWQAATAHVTSTGRTKVWADLSQPELRSFFDAIEVAFPGQRTNGGTQEPDPAPDTAPPTETPAGGDSAPATTDPEPTPVPVQDADPAKVDQDREALVAWIETRLPELPWLAIADLQNLTSAIREETLDGPAVTVPVGLSSTYEWKELLEPELREFWRRLPKKPLAPAGTAA